MAGTTEEDILGQLKQAMNFSLDEFKKDFERISSTALSINNVFGQSRERINELKVSLADATPRIVRLGGELTDVNSAISGIAMASRRNVIANTEDIEQMYAASKILDITVNDLSNSFMDVGIGISEIPKELEKSINYIQSIGGNTKQVMGDVRTNMDQMNRYQFTDGVQGLTKMAAQASMLRTDMSTTFSFAERLYQPEKAIEVAAAFQRLGVSSGALADPFQLMNQSINDPSGLQNSLAEMAKQFTYFDEKTKTFKINPQGVLTLKEIGEQAGIDSRELSKMGLAAAELDMRISDISKAGLTIASEEDKQYLANIATMQDGKYKVTLEDGTKKELAELTQPEFDKLIEQQKTGPKTLEEIARKQLNYGETIAADVGALKSAIIGGVVTQGDFLKVSESLRNATTTLTGAFSGAFADPKAVRGGLTSGIDIVKDLMKNLSTGSNMSISTAFEVALEKLDKQMGKGNEVLNEKFKQAINVASKTKRGEGTVDGAVSYLYKQLQGELNNVDKLGKEDKSGVKSRQDYRYLIEGRGASDIKRAVAGEGSIMGGKQSVNYDGNIDINVNITGEGAKDFTPAQKDELNKTITTVINSNEFKQMVYNINNSNSVTKVSRDTTYTGKR